MNITDVKLGLVLNLEEVRAIYRIIEREWINRDDDEAMAVANKISQFVYTHGETDAENNLPIPR